MILKRADESKSVEPVADSPIKLKRFLWVNPDLAEKQQTEDLQDTNTENTSSKEKRKWKRGDIIKVAILCLDIVGNGMMYALMASFFPIIAQEEKGLSIADVGIIMAALPVASVVFGTIISHFMEKMGKRRLLLASFIVAALALVPFSLVMYIPAGAKFYSVCMISRACQGIAFVSTQLAAFSIASVDYNDRMSTILGLLEMSIAIGMSLGPALGGVIYDVWGFIGPFMVLCAFYVILFVVNFIWIHPKEQEAEAETKEQSSTVANEFSLKSIWRIPILIIPIFNVFLVFNYYAVFDVAFGAFLSSTFGLSSSLIGLIFLCTVSSSAIASPIVGFITDKKGHCELLMIIGCFVTAPTFMFIGPVPYFNIEKNVWLTIFSAVVMLIGIAMMYVPMIKLCQQIIFANDYVDNDKSRNTITSLVIQTGNIGNAVGPFLSGFLVDSFDFELTAFMLGLVAAALGVIAIIPFIWFGSKKKEKEVKALQQEPSNIYSIT